MPAPLILAGLAAGGFIKGGGLQGIIGSGKRKREEQQAIVEQRERQYNYENFDYNQDVGPINDPYAGLAQKQEDYLSQRLDQQSANALQAQQQAGNFGATQALIGRTNEAEQANAQRVGQIRQQGALFVEQQRQQRIGQRYDQAETFLARADDRLSQAKAARRRATEKLYKGIGAGVTAAAGGLSGGGGISALKSGSFSGAGALQGSGLLPAQVAGAGQAPKYDAQTGELLNP